MSRMEMNRWRVHRVTTLFEDETSGSALIPIRRVYRFQLIGLRSMSIALVIRIRPTRAHRGPKIGRQTKTNARVGRGASNGNSHARPIVSFFPGNCGFEKEGRENYSVGILDDSFRDATFLVRSRDILSLWPRALIILHQWKIFNRNRIDRSIHPCHCFARSLVKHGTAIITHSEEVVPLATNRFLLFFLSLFLFSPPIFADHRLMQSGTFNEVDGTRTRVKNYFPRFVAYVAIIKITTDL